MAKSSGNAGLGERCVRRGVFEQADRKHGEGEKVARNGANEYVFSEM